MQWNGRHYTVAASEFILLLIGDGDFVAPSTRRSLSTARKRHKDTQPAQSAKLISCDEEKKEFNFMLCWSQVNILSFLSYFVFIFCRRSVWRALYRLSGIYRHFYVCNCVRASGDACVRLRNRQPTTTRPVALVSEYGTPKTHSYRCVYIRGAANGRAIIKIEEKKTKRTNEQQPEISFAFTVRARRVGKTARFQFWAFLYRLSFSLWVRMGIRAHRWFIWLT